MAGALGVTGANGVAAGGALLTGMNRGPFWPQPASASSNTVAPQTTGARYHANIGFKFGITIRIKIRITV